MLARHLLHFLLVGGNPKRFTLLIFDIFRQFRSQFLPQLLRVVRQRELRLGVVHDDDVSHACASGAAADDIAVDDHDPHAATRKFIRTGYAYDPCSDDDHVAGCFGHALDPNAHTERILRIQH